jgi:hypothetical protein
LASRSAALAAALRSRSSNSGTKAKAEKAARLRPPSASQRRLILRRQSPLPRGLPLISRDHF